MGKGRKGPRKNGTEGHRPKIPAPPPSPKETTKGASKSIAEGRLTVTVFRLSEEREVTEAPSDRQDETPKNPEFLINKIKDAPRTTSATESENKQKEVKQNQLKQEVRSQGERGMGEDVLGIWELVQEEFTGQTSKSCSPGCKSKRGSWSPSYGTTRGRV